MMSNHGLFIVFEGIDGAGKTTQVDLLQGFLLKAGLKVTRSKEPTDGKWGQKIRHSATHGRLSLEEELDAFTRDRREHSEQLIGPALAAGEIVILDRYFYSTIAYQGSRGADVHAVSESMTRQFPIPDVVFLIDVPPEVGISRISHGRKEQPNSFEKICSLTDARRVFLQLSKEFDHLCFLDGEQSIERVHALVLERLLVMLLKNNYTLITAPS